MTSTIYPSVASSMVIEAGLVHWWGSSAGNSFVKSLELTPSGWLIGRTVQTCAMVDHGGLPFRPGIHWSSSSLCAATEHPTFNLQPFTSLRISSPPTACSIPILLLLVVQMILKCASLVILREKLWRYRNQDMLWLLAQNYDMLLILPPCHGRVRVYYHELWDFIVCSLTSWLFARYCVILCVTVSSFAHNFWYRFRYRQIGVHIHQQYVTVTCYIKAVMLLFKIYATFFRVEFV